MSALETYVEFLPLEGQSMIQQLRHESQEPLSIVSGIHWIAHHKTVDIKLAKLIIIELNKILTSLNASNYSTGLVKSVAALTLTPDKCYDECFGTWEDYVHIQNLVPLLEMKAGRKILLRPVPNTNIARPLLWKRLQGDAFRGKIKNMMPDVYYDEN